MFNIIIYFLIDPRDGSVRYVGQTRNGLQRYKDHLRLAETPEWHGMRKLYYWIRSLQKKGLQPELRVVEYLDNVDQLDEAEIYWGELCKSLGCPLTNVAPFGSNGKWKLTEQGLAKRKRVGPDHHHWGKSPKPSTIAKMKAAHAGKTWTVEQIAKSAAARRKPFKCVETNEIFKSIQDFVDRGYGSSRVKHVLNGHCETYKGFHFERIVK